MKTWFWMYNNNSKGGKALKETMGLKAILHEGSTFVGSPDKTVINWGYGARLPAEVAKCRIINKPEAIALSVNKLDALRRFAGACRTPDWTTRQATAQDWLNSGHTVYCRHRLEGHEGEGIEIIAPRAANLTAGGDLGILGTILAGWINGRPEPNLGLVPHARLYTKFVTSTREYRVHVVGGEVVAVHRKVSGVEEGIRNTANGWVFRRVSEYPRDVCTQAQSAVRALGLDFAAVDVLWDDREAYVLETNTAPGIDEMDWTLRQYALALERLVG